MPRSVAPRAQIRAALLALTCAAFACAAAACSSDVGVVPTCEPDVTKDGIQLVDGGCSRFAICLNDAGNQVPSSECCKDADGKPLTGNDLAICLYGYGVTSAPTGGGGSSGATTGAGGAGGKP